MLTNKLLAAVAVAGALIAGAASDASANPWRGRGPAYRAPVRVVVAPAYRPVYRPVVVAPMYVPPPRVVVVPAPVYQPVVYRHPHWHHGHRHGW